MGRSVVDRGALGRAGTGGVLGDEGESARNDDVTADGAGAFDGVEAFGELVGAIDFDVVVGEEGKEVVAGDAASSCRSGDGC